MSPEYDNDSHNWIFAETEEYGAIFLGEPKASFSPVTMIGASYDQHPHTEQYDECEKRYVGGFAEAVPMRENKGEE
jgi:hypothetical protein